MALMKVCALPGNDVDLYIALRRRCGGGEAEEEDLSSIPSLCMSMYGKQGRVSRSAKSVELMEHMHSYMTREVLPSLASTSPQSLQHEHLALIASYLSWSPSSTPSLFYKAKWTNTLVPSLLASLGEKQGAHCLSLAVACLAFLIEAHASAVDVLGEGNVSQMIKLCLSKAMYPSSSPSIYSSCLLKSPMFEVSYCRIALKRLLVIPSVACQESTRSELCIFASKWYERLYLAAIGQSVTSAVYVPRQQEEEEEEGSEETQPASRTALSVLDDFLNIEDLHFFHAHYANTLLPHRPLDEVLGPYLVCQDDRTVVAACKLVISTLSKRSNLLVPAVIQSILSSCFEALRGTIAKLEQTLNNHSNEKCNSDLKKHRSSKPLRDRTNTLSQETATRKESESLQQWSQSKAREAAVFSLVAVLRSCLSSIATSTPHSPSAAQISLLVLCVQIACDAVVESKKEDSIYGHGSLRGGELCFEADEVEDDASAVSASIYRDGQKLNDPAATALQDGLFLLSLWPLGVSSIKQLLSRVDEQEKKTILSAARKANVLVGVTDNGTHFASEEEMSVTTDSICSASSSSPAHAFREQEHQEHHQDNQEDDEAGGQGDMSITRIEEEGGSEEASSPASTATVSITYSTAEQKFSVKGPFFPAACNEEEAEHGEEKMTLLVAKVDELTRQGQECRRLLLDCEKKVCASSFRIQEQEVKAQGQEKLLKEAWERLAILSQSEAQARSELSAAQSWASECESKSLAYANDASRVQTCLVETKAQIQAQARALQKEQRAHQDFEREMEQKLQHAMRSYEELASKADESARTTKAQMVTLENEIECLQLRSMSAEEAASNFKDQLEQSRAQLDQTTHKLEQTTSALQFAEQQLNEERAHGEMIAAERDLANENCSAMEVELKKLRELFAFIKDLSTEGSSSNKESIRRKSLSLGLHSSDV